MSTKQILWENLQALMFQRYGEENLYRLYKESNTEISLGSLSRIKAQETAVGLDVLDRLANFFCVTPAMLITKGLDRHPLDEYKKDFDSAADNQKSMLLVMLASLNRDSNINDQLFTETASQKHSKVSGRQRLNH